jgi:hypothetical protein
MSYVDTLFESLDYEQFSNIYINDIAISEIMSEFFGEVVSYHTQEEFQFRYTYKQPTKVHHQGDIISCGYLVLLYINYFVNNDINLKKQSFEPIFAASAVKMARVEWKDELVEVFSKGDNYEEESEEFEFVDVTTDEESEDSEEDFDEHSKKKGKGSVKKRDKADQEQLDESEQELKKEQELAKPQEQVDKNEQKVKEDQAILLTQEILPEEPKSQIQENQGKNSSNSGLMLSVHNTRAQKRKAAEEAEQQLGEIKEEKSRVRKRRRKVVNQTID